MQGNEEMMENNWRPNLEQELEYAVNENMEYIQEMIEMS